MMTSILKQILWCGLTLSSAFSPALGQQYYDYTSPFNPAGEYHPLNKPTEARFLQFHLRVRHKSGKLLASGEVSDVQFYRFRNVIVTKKHLRFSTERRGGISYSFEGTFFRAGNFPTMLSTTPGFLPLQGTLRKFVNGRKVMELSTPFVYYVGC
jgi:hypothetical protein